jgi:uncharacterized OB-fold protein
VTTLECKRAWARTKRAQLRAAGICAACGKGEAPAGSACGQCRAKAREYEANKRAAKVAERNP